MVMGDVFLFPLGLPVFFLDFLFYPGTCIYIYWQYKRVKKKSITQIICEINESLEQLHIEEFYVCSKFLFHSSALTLNSCTLGPDLSTNPCSHQ